MQEKLESCKQLLTGDNNKICERKDARGKCVGVFRTCFSRAGIVTMGENTEFCAG